MSVEERLKLSKERLKRTFGTLRVTSESHLNSRECLRYRDQLTVLNLSGLILKTVPDWIFSSIPHLHWLDLRSNKLITIPVSVNQCVSLRTLMVDSNILSELPLHLAHNDTLQTLTFRDNIIRQSLVRILSELFLFV